MRTDTKLRSSERPCSFDHFLKALGHQPATALQPIPRTLRDHIGAREFGDFGAFLMTDKPATADLSDRVARWRTIDASARQDLPLRAHPDQSADDRRFRFAVSVTTIVFSGWIFIGVVAAALSGKL